jgi:hypothetical protein
MKRLSLAALLALACAPAAPAERYGFVARLGRDTVSVESVTRQGNTITSDAVDRFPRVHRRHTVITLGPDGGVRHLVMDIHTPSEPADQRERHVVADVTNDTVRVTKTDKAGTVERAFATNGGIVMAHVPQMYSLYELYFAAGLKHAAAKQPAADTAQLRQFYPDREFDRFPLHRALVRRLPGGKAEISHDWLSGTGEATLDSAYHLTGYSGARTTYKVSVERLATPPDIKPVADKFEVAEAQGGGVKQLSVRDTVRASIGAAAFTVDYGRPLARGRTLLGDVIPFDYVWRTGANAATQFTTSAPVTIGGLRVPAGAYTLWTSPHANGVDLIVNKQTGQWGTEYGPAHDLGRARLTSETLTTPVEQFTISVAPRDNTHGTLAMEWGTFRWTAPIEVR